MKTNSIGIVKSHIYNFGAGNENALKLDCGKILKNVEICYETYGELNSSKTNAILVEHPLSGTAHAAGYFSEEDKKPGWWETMIGPGKAFDTNKYFIVSSNVIGGCSGSTGPRSINYDTGKLYNRDFPVITIADMVRAQHRLMQFLEIEKWLAIAGGSMGGMQALEWSVTYPEAVESVLAIATTTRLTPQGIAFDWVGREAIMNDVNWSDGEYYETPPERGLSTARMLAHITYLSEESMNKKFGRDLQESDKYSFDFDRDFAIESYLQYQGNSFVERFDANSYLYITRAIDYFDLSAKSNGVLSEAFKNTKSKFLVVSFSSDWLFPPSHSEELVKALIENELDVSYCDVESGYGHDAFLLEVETLGALVRGFIDNCYEGDDND